MNFASTECAAAAGDTLWHVWIIDDDPLTRGVIAQLLHDELKPATLKLRQIDSFEAAAALLQGDAQVDLIILDNFLGDGEGIDLLPGITRFSQRFKPAQVPVMMVSGNDSQRFLARCFAEGASDYVIKPFDTGLLGYKAHAMLRAKRNQDVVAEQKLQLEQLIARRAREEAMARFTYEFYLRRTHTVTEGVYQYMVTPNAFSGDLLLSARSPEGRTVIMLADAMGHDLTAAITLVPVISIFQRMVSKGFRLSHILLELNQRLLEDTPGDSFVAATLFELVPQKGKVYIWNGGMPPVLEINGSGEVVHEYPSRHMALGILPSSHFSTDAQVTELWSGNWMMSFSDGLTEQMDEHGRLFGLDAIRSCLQPEPGASLKYLKARLDEWRGAQALTDDLTCCALHPIQVYASVELGANEPARELFATLAGMDAFDWHYTISGQHIAGTHIQVLCNELLEQIEPGRKLCERVLTIFTELYVNAVDHGLLGLDSRLKSEPDGFFQYMSERAERMTRLGAADCISVSICWHAQAALPYLSISVQDSGKGFALTDASNPDSLEAVYGRGLKMVKNLASRMEITPPGNRVTAYLDSPVGAPTECS